MVTSRKNSEPTRPRRPPATTPESRENQLIAAAVDLAERQILDGSASSQVITHFLKLASTRNKLEEQKIAHEVELLKAKSESMASGKRMEELYAEAMDAFRGYQGQEPVEQDYEN